MRKIAILSTMITALVLSTTAVPLPKISKLAAQGPSHVCMQRTTSGRQGGDGVFTIIVKHNSQSVFLSKGFSIANCYGKLSSRANYRTQMCNLANNAPQPIKDNFTSVHGATPSQLCEMAGGTVERGE